MLKNMLVFWLAMVMAAVAEPAPLAVDFLVVKLEIGQELVPPLARGSSPPLLVGAKTVRESLFVERGVFFPSFNCIDSDELQPKEYVIFIREVEVGRGLVEPGQWLDVTAGKWISAGQRGPAVKAGHSLLKPEEVILGHLKQLAVRHGARLLGRQDMLGLVPTLLSGILSTDLPAQDCCLRICHDLLRERVPLQFNRIAEIVLDSAQPQRDSDRLGELARRELRQELCADLAVGKTISAVMLSSAWESRLQPAVRYGAAGLEIEEAATLETALAEPLSRLLQGKQTLVLCVREDLRLALRRLTERQFPQVTVLATSEVAPGYTLKKLGEL